MKPDIKQRLEQIRRGELPEGYGLSMFRAFPLDWHSSKLEEVSNITSGSTPSRDSCENFSGSILWVTSGELKEKYLTDTKEKISEKASKNSHLKLYDKGTVIIAIYGLEAAGVRGTASIISHRCTISQACIAFDDLKNINNEFFYYWYIFNGPLIGSHYAQGTKQQNLSTDIIGKLKIHYPDLYEQQKIATILATQDRVMELKEKLLGQKKLRKKYLMQQLLTGKRRLPGFTGEWKKYKFHEICTSISSRHHQINTSEYLISGRFPVIDQGKQKIIAFSNCDKKVIKCPKDGIIVFGDHTREIKYLTFDFIVGADGTQLLKANPDNAVTEYVYYLMLNTRIPNDGYSRHFKYLKSFIYEMPSKTEQIAISQIFMKLDSEIDLMDQSIELEKQKKRGLMQLLLTGIVRTSGDSNRVVV